MIRKTPLNDTRHQMVKMSVNFPHLIPPSLIDDYLEKSMPFWAGIKSVDVRYVSLSKAEYDYLHDACMHELWPSRDMPSVDPYAIDIDLPKLGLKGGAK